jgi:hypothetical protein
MIDFYAEHLNGKNISQKWTRFSLHLEAVSLS